MSSPNDDTFSRYEPRELYVATFKSLKPLNVRLCLPFFLDYLNCGSEWNMTPLLAIS